MCDLRLGPAPASAKLHHSPVVCTKTGAAVLAKEGPGGRHRNFQVTVTKGRWGLPELKMFSSTCPNLPSPMLK